MALRGVARGLHRPTTASSTPYTLIVSQSRSERSFPARPCVGLSRTPDSAIVELKPTSRGVLDQLVGIEEDRGLLQLAAGHQRRRETADLPVDSPDFHHVAPQVIGRSHAFTLGAFASRHREIRGVRIPQNSTGAHVGSLGLPHGMFRTDLLRAVLPEGELQP